jgi:Helitron helicase-like domain at N-terminus
VIQWLHSHTVLQCYCGLCRLRHESLSVCQVRKGCVIPHAAGRLFHQYAVDCYARIEQQRLRYLRDNQINFRADLYQGVFDAALAGETNVSNIGRRVILPSSFIGGPRHMQQLFQDAMGIVRELGKPDLFVTFTCNPKWPS